MITLDSNYFIGIMSGTSLDGIDAALCRITGGSFEWLERASLPMPEALGAELLALQAPSADEIGRAMLAGNALAEVYAEACKQLLETANLPASAIAAVGCHGQTIRHRPALGYTVQLNNGALLAELSGIDVICDFRSRDIAAGGQGAPLVPAFHAIALSAPNTGRAIVNIGGMANITRLTRSGEVSGFDCGPGNILMDAWSQHRRQRPFDENGRWARRGTVSEGLLRALRAHPFISSQPPKSCGREEFNLAWLTSLPGVGHLREVDVQATLLEFTALSITDAIRTYCPQTDEIFVCGGGARNTWLMSRIAELARPSSVATTDALGLPVDMVEACAFAWLAYAFVRERPGNLPSVTGARGLRVLGALHRH